MFPIEASERNLLTITVSRYICYNSVGTATKPSTAYTLASVMKMN